MKTKTDILTASYLLFFILLLLSGLLSAPLADTVYYLAFPISYFLGARLSGEAESPLSSFKIKRDKFPLFLATVFPTVAVIFGLSCLANIVIFALTGRTSSPQISDNLPLAILTSALLPAILEEVLFRELPMRVMREESPLELVLTSALFFSFVHHSFFAIPYAFFAGVAFIVIDLLCDSLLPSIIIHFLNNLLSVLWIFYSERIVFVWAFVSVLLLLALISAVFLFLKRKAIVRLFKERFGKFTITAPSKTLLIFIIPSLVIATMELFS